MALMSLTSASVHPAQDIFDVRLFFFAVEKKKAKAEVKIVTLKPCGVRQSGAARLERMKHGRGIKGRDDKSMTDVLPKINPTDPLILA